MAQRGHRQWRSAEKSATMRNCAISDISDGGARLVLANGDDLPDSFILPLTKAGAARRRCGVIWRTGATVGVAFNGPAS